MSPSTLLIVGAVVVIVWLLWRGAGGSGGPEVRLLKICQGNAAQAERLTQAELNRAPGISRSEAAARAVQRYERDNR
jgi:hypothetical protein